MTPDLHRMLERLNTTAPAGQDAEHLAALHEAIALLEQDPTLALRGETAGTTRTCVGPGCGNPLPAAEPGRERRYCSPACRRRAKR